MNLGECFRKRFLRKIRPDKDKSLRSIEIAENKLEKARVALSENLFDMCIVFGYTAMFHAARALLYRDGIQEKSHTCVIIYLKENYLEKLSLSLINALDAHRIERHEALYGIEFIITKDDCETAIEDAEIFIKKVEELLGSK